MAKSSFFKVFLYDQSSTQLRIPPAFREHVEAEPSKKVSLKGPSGSHWQVGLVKNSDGVFFGDGWKHFVADQSLVTGDFLVFQYDGDSRFSVFVFDKTACEKKAAFSARPSVGEVVEEEEEVIIKEVDDVLPVIGSSRKKRKCRSNLETQELKRPNPRPSYERGHHTSSSGSTHERTKSSENNKEAHLSPDSRALATEYMSHSQSICSKRKRGRPKKKSGENVKNSSSTCSKRGRPKKREENVKNSSSNCSKRGRPKKRREENVKNSSSNCSKRGRPKKRSEENVKHVGVVRFNEVIEKAKSDFQSSQDSSSSNCSKRGRPKKRSEENVKDIGVVRFHEVIEKAKSDFQSSQDSTLCLLSRETSTLKQHSKAWELLCSRKGLFQRGDSVKIPRPGSLISQRRLVTEGEVNRTLVKAMSFKSTCPFALKVMQEGYVYSSFLLTLPAWFARKHLPKKNTDITLLDPNGRTWTSTFISSRGALSGGWCKFSYANNLERYDVCVFELVKKTRLRVHIFRVVNEIAPLLRYSPPKTKGECDTLCMTS